MLLYATSFSCNIHCGVIRAVCRERQTCLEGHLVPACLQPRGGSEHLHCSRTNHRTPVTHLLCFPFTILDQGSTLFIKRAPTEQTFLRVANRMRKCKSRISLWTVWLRLQWKMIQSTSFITNPLHQYPPFPTQNNHFLCSCPTPTTHLLLHPWGNGKMTQGIYLLAKPGFPLRLLNVQRYFSSHESQHFPAGKDLEDNLGESSH